jgi:hypothetical protein
MWRGIRALLRRVPCSETPSHRRRARRAVGAQVFRRARSRTSSRLPSARTIFTCLDAITSVPRDGALGPAARADRADV